MALLFDKQSNNSLLNKLLALIIIISAYNSFSFLAAYTNRDVRAENHDIYAEHKSIPLQKYFSALPMGATIYLDRGGGPGPLDWVICFYESFIDHSGDKYLHLAKIDPRFKYKIVSDINSAGYIARNNNSSIDNSKYELLGTEKGVCLLRKKNWQTAY